MRACYDLKKVSYNDGDPVVEFIKYSSDDREVVSRLEGDEASPESRYVPLV